MDPGATPGTPTGAPAPTAPAIPSAREATAAESVADAPVHEPPGATPTPGRRWRWLPRYGWAGSAYALTLAYLSFTPSLLPRSWLLQGVIAGVAAAVGYGLGCVLAWIVYQFTDRRPGPGLRRRAWQVLGVLAVLGGAVTLWAAHGWQRQINELMGLEPPSGYRWLGTLLVAPVLFALLVGVARLVRRLTRWVIRLIGRVVPPRPARAIGAVAVTVLLVFLLNGVLFRGAVELANNTFSVRDGGTEEGTERPAASERSGSPASLVSWDSLGRQGRNFTALGPTTEQLSAFSGRPALEPVRAYAGLESADDTDAQAALAVRDLQRAGGFDRQVLVVATTTGTGWVDPAASDSLEYMFNGDTAIVAMQYSYLPSWISLLVDQEKAREAGRALFDQVYGVWAQLPPDQRPELYVFGESLGSFGGEAAFTGLNDIVNRTDGVLWVGPPNANELWQKWTDARDAGSPEWRPVYQDGRTVRWADDPADLDSELGAWDDRRVLYLQNASDPIVWWSPELLLQEPDWLRGERGPDVDQSMSWIRFVTFWQVSADMPFATGVPAGHGHHYTADYVDGWAAVTRPDGWTDADTERLREIIAR